LGLIKIVINKFQLISIIFSFQYFPNALLSENFLCFFSSFSISMLIELLGLPLHHQNKYILKNIALVKAIQNTKTLIDFDVKTLTVENLIEV